MIRNDHQMPGVGLIVMKSLKFITGIFRYCFNRAVIKVIQFIVGYLIGLEILWIAKELIPGSFKDPLAWSAFLWAVIYVIVWMMFHEGKHHNHDSDMPV